MKALRLLISGRVQGVYYRKSTQLQARELGLAGWVRNLPDGRVEVHCEGPDQAVDELVAWCYQGPPDALVRSVEQHPTLFQAYSTFEVLL